jgi:adhesin transport system membrane fusion protein
MSHELATQVHLTKLDAERRQRRSSRIILSSALLMASAIGWGYYAKLDQTSRATGQIIPAGHDQIIQAPDGGQIKQILVKEGDHVEAHQPMFLLDQVKMRAGVDEARGRLAALEAQMARIDAELFDKPLSFPAGAGQFHDIEASQQQLYTKRRIALHEQLASLDRMHSLAQNELDLNQPLLKSGDVSRSEVIRLQRQVVDIEAQSSNTRNKYIQDLQAEYAKVGEDLVTAREVLKQRLAGMQDTVIRAPTAGVVKNVRFTTEGGVLRAADELAQVVPTGQELIVEAKVSPSDIAYIRPGQGASLKFDAYDSSIFGGADGVVTYISPDTLSESGPGGGEHTYYRVHIRVDTRNMKGLGGRPVQLQPGMTATVEIKTGGGTVLNYLLKPLVKTLSEAMNEK